MNVMPKYAKICQSMHKMQCVMMWVNLTWGDCTDLCTDLCVFVGTVPVTQPQGVAHLDIKS